VCSILSNSNILIATEIRNNSYAILNLIGGFVCLFTENMRAEDGAMLPHQKAKQVLAAI
jgi:hypothetical protein